MSSTTSVEGSSDESELETCSLCCEETREDEKFVFECETCVSASDSGIGTPASFVCFDCTKKYCIDKITEMSWNIVCPLHKLPDLSVNDPANATYADNLCLSLAKVLDAETLANVERLMRERTDSFSPDFRRCPKCRSGYIASTTKRCCSRCPHCRSEFCVDCKADWMDQHENILCDKFAQWKLDNGGAASENAIALLRRSADVVWMECRRCQTDMIIEPPIGCLHITCRCSHESCLGCSQPMHRRRCSVATCTYSGIHGHHPRYCAYYLRDYTVNELTGLLHSAGVAIPPAVSTSSEKCKALVHHSDDSCVPCGQPVVYAAYQCCSSHSQLYLAQLIRKHRIDPLPIMDVQSCMQEVRRLGISMPYRDAYDDDPKYKVICEQAIRRYSLY